MDKKDLRIVFLGTPEFAVHSLDALVSNGFNIVGVVTMPDKPAGRGHHMLQSAVKKYAVDKGLYLMQPVKLKDEAFVEELRGLEADLFVVIAFRMLPEVVWAMPRLGTFNLHASLLPKYRGAAPINWAVMNGDKVTGVTTFFLKHEIDTGDIISQREITIDPDECVGSVHDRLMELGAELTVKTVNDILAGTLKTIPQQELAEEHTMLPAPKIFKDTCRIDWTRTVAQVHNHVRGLSPYPAAWTMATLDDGKPFTMKILRTSTAVGTSTPDGASTPAPVSTKASDSISQGTGTCVADTTASNATRLTAQCADGPIEILELQPEGKRPMPAADYLRGIQGRTLRFT